MTAIPPVDGLTIGAALRRAAARRPDGEALVFPQAGFRATYSEMDARVDGVARSLLALGIRAQAVGVPDPRFGEEVCVWIRLRRGATATADEIRSFCKSRLAYFEVPRYVKFVDEFPLTVTGKVQKFRIREQEIEEYGLGPGHGDVAYDDKTDGHPASPPEPVVTRHRGSA